LPGYKEPTVLLDDGINIRTTGLFTAMSAMTHPLLPFRRDCRFQGRQKLRMKQSLCGSRL
jgi:hypothetical protein